MKNDEVLATLDRIVRDMKLAQLTRALMGGVRLVHENDASTLQRIVEEYKHYKYSKLRADQRALVKEAHEKLTCWIKENTPSLAACSAVELLEEVLKIADLPWQVPNRFLEKADDLLDEVGTTNDVDRIYELTIQARENIEQAKQAM